MQIVSGHGEIAGSAAPALFAAHLPGGKIRAALIDQANQCRRLADAALDDRTRVTLMQMAAECEARAAAVDQRD